MNWKQLVCMWLGIAAAVFFGFLLLCQPSGRPCYISLSEFFITFFLITLITGGLIVTFKDKKPKYKEGEKG